MLSHINADNDPSMVDVSGKTPAKRCAHARSIVVLPDTVAALFSEGDIQSKKGPVFNTAILAGIMAAKKTSELIPLCHPLGLDDCSVTVEMGDGGEVVIDCYATITHKTGVEMEALTGASVAALTIYDMCKAVSHDIVIKETRLIEKRGGKSGYAAQ